MSFFDSIASGFEDLGNAITGFGRRFANSVVSFGESTWSYALIAGNGIASAGQLISNGVVSYGDDAARFSLSSAGTAWSFAKTSAYDVESFTKSAAVSVAGFSIDLYQPALQGLKTAWHVISSLLAKTLPELDEPSGAAEIVARCVLGVMSYRNELMAMSCGMTIATVLHVDAGALFNISYPVGLYVDFNRQWGFIKLTSWEQFKNLGTASLSFNVGISGTIDMYYVFGPRSRFGGTKYFDLGGDVQIEVLKVGGALLLDAGDLSFLGFRVSAGLSLALSPGAMDASGKRLPTKVELSASGQAIDMASLHEQYGNRGPVFDTAVRAMQTPGMAPHLGVAAQAAACNPFTPRFYGYLRPFSQPNKLLSSTGGAVGLADAAAAGSLSRFRIVAGLSDPRYISLEALDATGYPYYLLWSGASVMLVRYVDNTSFNKQQATWAMARGLADERRVSLRPIDGSLNYLYLTSATQSPPGQLGLGPISGAATSQSATFLLDPQPLPNNQTAVLLPSETLAQGDYRRSPDGRYFIRIEDGPILAIHCGSGPLDIRQPPAGVGAPGTGSLRPEVEIKWNGQEFPMGMVVPTRTPYWITIPVNNPSLGSGVCFVQGSDPNAADGGLGEILVHGDPQPRFLAVSDGGRICVLQGLPARPGELLASSAEGRYHWATSRRTVALKGANGCFLGYDGTTLICKNSGVGPNESWELATLWNGKYALRTAGGTYLALSFGWTLYTRFTFGIVDDTVLYLDPHPGGTVVLRGAVGACVGVAPNGQVSLKGYGDDPQTYFTVVPLERKLAAETGRAFSLTAKHSGKRLAVAGGSKAAGARIVQQAETGGRNQSFTLGSTGTGFFGFAAQHSGLVLAVQGQSMNPGAALVSEATVSGNAAQAFLLVPSEDGTYFLVAAHSGKTLEVAANRVEDGAVLIQSERTGLDNQRFYIRPEPPLVTRVLVAEVNPGLVPQYLERLAQSAWLNGCLELGGVRLCGDFAGRGRAQLLCIRRDPGGSVPLVVDLSGGAAPGEVVFPNAVANLPWVNGWFDEIDWQRAGDFLHKGRSQLLLLNRGGDGGRLGIVDLQPLATAPAPALTLIESWGQQRSLFTDWHDDDALWLCGDLLGLGFDQLLCVNRKAGAGRAMVVRFDDGTARVAYQAPWDSAPWLDGWTAGEVRHQLGDFLGLGRAQWLMVDSRSSAVQLVDLWGSQPRVLFSVSGPTLLAGFQRAGDWLLPGDFLGRGRAQLLGVSRQPGAGDRLAFVEFAGNGAMAVVYNQPFSKRGCLDGLLESGDSLYAADFQGTGGKRVQLLVTNPNTQSESAAAPSFGLGNRPASIPVPSYFGNRFIAVGDAYGVVAMAWHQGALYIVSNNHLYKRLSFAEGSGNAWGEAGEAYGVVAMASHQGSLYIVSNNHLYKRGALGPGTGNDWVEAGEAYGVVAMTSHQGSLYIVSSNHLYKRGALGPGTGNDWGGEVGEAYGVLGMASHQGVLYVTSNSRLYQRGRLGPGTGNDWAAAGNAVGATFLTGSGQTLYAVNGNSLQKLAGSGPVPSADGNRWLRLGDAYGVVAMAWHQGALYIVSNNHLYKRLSFAEGSGNAWGEAGEAYGVAAMASHQGSLYIVSNNHLYKRGALGPGTGNDWGEAGEAYGVTAMASHQGSLYIVSNNHLYKRGALGPGTGNDWSGEVGEAWNVPTMTSHQGELYILSVQNRCLYRRGAIGPSTGNDWFSAGNAAGVIQLASSEATVFSVCDNGLYILN